MESIQSYQDLLGFKTLTPVQKTVIPKVLKKQDVIVSSPTGSGKSHAFILPLLTHINLDKNDVQVTIIAPTAMLAEQLYQMTMDVITKASQAIRVMLIAGGKDKARAIKKLLHQQPHIVIGTPGRLHDLALKERVLKLHTTQHLILDEADMTLDAGFLPLVDGLARTMPKTLHMGVFSATIPQALEPFLKKYLHQPLRIDHTKEVLKQLNIEHRFVFTDAPRRLEQLKFVLSHLNPYLALIFAAHKEDVARIHQMMTSMGLNAHQLSGDTSERERKQLRRDLDAMRVQYLIASDMAARGLDLEDVSHVINYTLPKDMTFYLHRIGRTGRMGKTGEAITLYTQDDVEALRKLRPYGIDIDALMLANKKRKRK